MDSKRSLKYCIKDLQNSQNDNNHSTLDEKSKRNSKFPTIPIRKNDLDPQQSHTGIEQSISEKTIVSSMSRFPLLPPIDSGICPGSPATKVERIHTSHENLKNYENIQILLNKSNHNLEKSVALPPIDKNSESKNTIKHLTGNYTRIMQENSEHLEPRKRAKTHIVHKIYDRGDAWELVKAEKIRCNELHHYKTNVQQNKNKCKHKYREDDEKRMVKRKKTDRPSSKYDKERR